MRLNAQNTRLGASADAHLRCHYMSVPPRVKWEGWGSPKTWRALAGSQALGGHSSRQRCTGRTPQGPQRGRLTGAPVLSTLGTPSVRRLHTQNRLLTDRNSQLRSHFRCDTRYVSKLTYENLHRGQRVVLPVHVLQFVLRGALLCFGTDGVELVPFLYQLLGRRVRHLERLAGQGPVQTKRTQNHCEGKKKKTKEEGQ